MRKTGLLVFAIAVVIGGGVWIWQCAGSKTANDHVGHRPIQKKQEVDPEFQAKMDAIHKKLDSLPIPEVADVVKEYVQGSDVLEPIIAMDILLEKWKPVGKDVGELEQLLGPPHRRTDTSVSYSIDNGLFGGRWRFVLEGRRIVRVETVSLN